MIKTKIFVWLLLLPAIVLSGCSTWYLGKEVEDDSYINWQTLTADEAKALIEKEELNPKGIYAGKGKTPALMSPIMKVVQNQGNPDVVDVLVKHGADVNEYAEVAQSKEKHTALDFALYDGNIDIVQRLLELGAGVESQDPLNDPPAIHYVLRHIDIELVTKKKMIDLLINYGADVNALDYSLQKHSMVITPLMDVVRKSIRIDQKYDDIELISYLVSRGAEINISPSGSTFNAMNTAVLAEDSRVIKELIKLGGDVNLSTDSADNCWSPLIQYVAMGRNIGILDLLVAEDVDVICGTDRFLEMIKLRKEGEIDDIYLLPSISKIRDSKNGITTIKEWRAFSDTIIERLALHCKKQEHNICNTLEQIEKALRREAEKNRLVLREV